MSLQARMSKGDDRLYNPGRDVAHNFKEVMETVAARLESTDQWFELAAILKQNKITDNDLGEACAAYCRYLVSAVESPQTPMAKAIEQAGFFNTKPAAQVAVMAMIGTVYAGIQHVGVREATMGGVGPMHDALTLVKEAESLLEYMRYPRWRRKLLKFFNKLKTALTSFRT